MGDRIPGMFQLLHDGDSVFIEQGSLVGQGGLFADAVKEMDVQLLLQLFDLNGDSCLGITQLLGCLGKAL